MQKISFLLHRMLEIIMKTSWVIAMTTPLQASSIQAASIRLEIVDISGKLQSFDGVNLHISLKILSIPLTHLFILSPSLSLLFLFRCCCRRRW